MTSCSAELSKIAHNALFAQRISSINSLSAICDHFDADISDVTKACGLNPRIGPHGLQAGIGFGGSCLRKDTLGLAGLAHELSLNEISDYWSQVIVINEVQTRRFVQELHQLLLFSKTKKIAMLGFAYKKDTGDPRGSIAKDIIISLFERGVSVKLHDPLVSMQDITNELGQYQGRSKHDSGFLGSLELFSTPYDACEGTSIIAVMNDASEYQCLDWGRVGASLSGEKVVLDGRNFLDDELLRPYGITIKRLGRK
ncbi:hypothetical protein J1614_010913 [Plenodomus biglobosus]|nr:hypothetical protein J1614_010913 [Plenodomus biglobosus]